MKSKKIRKPTPTEELVIYRKHKSQEQQRLRSERVANGLCRYCSKRQMPGRNYCEFHHNYHKQHPTRKMKRDSMGRKRPHRGRGYNTAVRARLKAVLDGITLLSDLRALSEPELARLANCSDTSAHYYKKARIKELIK